MLIKDWVFLFFWLIAKAPRTQRKTVRPKNLYPKGAHFSKWAFPVLPDFMQDRSPKSEIVLPARTNKSQRQAVLVDHGPSACRPAQ